MSTMLRTFWWWWWWWQLVVFCCAVPLKNDSRCSENITSLGWTSPKGDITLIEGSDLEINCTIFEVQGLRNSSNIVWRVNNAELNSSLVSTLDERTAQLKIPNVTVGHSGKYWCVLKPNDGVCLNSVCIGTSPVITEDQFDCVSNKWKTLKCTWPESYQCTKAKIKWEVSYSQGNHRSFYKCPKYSTSNGSHSCEINAYDYPPYPLGARIFYFKLVGRNAFANSVFNFKVDHFAIVIPEKVSPFKVYQSGIKTLNLEWTMNDAFVAFPVNVIYLLKYRSEYSDVWEMKFFGPFPVDRTVSDVIKGITPNTLYIFSLRCRSEKAVDTERMWSEPNVINYTTLSSAPDSSVQTVNSSFVEKNAISDKRDIEIYWKNFSRSQYNGPGFHYLIEIKSENGSADSQNVSHANFKAVFPKLWRNRSYTFKVWAVNQIGRSEHSGEIFVPKSDDKLPCPKKLSVLNYMNGIYDVSWRHQMSPFDQQVIQHYTVFWCKKQSSERCSLALNWEIVQPNITSINITTDKNSGDYEVYISVDGFNGRSSGLCRSPCQVKADDVVPRKMKPPKVTSVSSSEIIVEWTLECRDKLISIAGFAIRYCTTTSSCLHGGSLKQDFVMNSEATSTILKGLDYFTTYNVSIAALTSSISGDFSEFATVTTDEDEPSEPRNTRLLSATNGTLTICFDQPLKPNGILKNYKIIYNNSEVSIPFEKNMSYCYTREHLESYKNYSVIVKACNSKLCSSNAQSILFTTDVGVPEKPRSLTVFWKNDTHVFVTWEPPHKINGPLHSWTLSIEETDKELKELELAPEINNSTIELRCFGPEWNVTPVIRLRANVQQLSGEDTLNGIWKEAPVPPCLTKDYHLISQNSTFAVVLGLSCLLLILVVLVVYIVKCTNYKGCKMYNGAKIILPKGLGKDEIQDYHNKLKSEVMSCSPAHYYSADLICQPGGQSVKISEIHNQSMCASSSVKSICEILPSRNQRRHNDSSDSYSSTRTGKTSISSSHTTYSHMSDSGTEADLPTPDTPDQVFSFKDWVGVSDSHSRDANNEVASQQQQHTNNQDGDKALHPESLKESSSQLSAVHQYCKAYKIIAESPDIEPLSNSALYSTSDGKSANVDQHPLYSCVGLSLSTVRMKPTGPSESVAGQSVMNSSVEHRRYSTSLPTVYTICDFSSEDLRGKAAALPSYVAYNPEDESGYVGRQVGYGYSRVGHFRDVGIESPSHSVDRCMLNLRSEPSNSLADTVPCPKSVCQEIDSNAIQSCGEGYVLTIATDQDGTYVNSTSPDAIPLKDHLNCSWDYQVDSADNCSVDDNNPPFDLSTLDHVDSSSSSSSSGSEKDNRCLYLDEANPAKNYVPLVSHSLSPSVVQDEAENSAKPYCQVAC